MAIQYKCDKCENPIGGVVENQAGNHPIPEVVSNINIFMTMGDELKSNYMGGELCEDCRKKFIQYIQAFIMWPICSRDTKLAKSP